MTHAKFSQGLIPLSLASIAVLVGGFALVAFYTRPSSIRA